MGLWLHNLDLIHLRCELEKRRAGRVQWQIAYELKSCHSDLSDTIIQGVGNLLFKQQLRASLFSPNEYSLGEKGCRNALIALCDSDDPASFEGGDPHFWCPILGNWLPPEEMVATEIFPYAHKQQVMTAIFGHPGPRPHDRYMYCANELFISSAAKKLLKLGVLTIVPDIPDLSDDAAMVKWAASEPKEYKVQIMRPQRVELSKEVPGRHKFPGVFWGHRCWNDLNNKRLQFRTSWRPNPKFLFWQYLVAYVAVIWSAEEPSQWTQYLMSHQWTPEEGWINIDQLGGVFRYLYGVAAPTYAQVEHRLGLYLISQQIELALARPKKEEGSSGAYLLRI